MVSIHYGKRTRSKTFLHTGSMTPIKQDEQRGWNRYVEERDRRLRFGELKREQAKEGETNEE